MSYLSAKLFAGVDDRIQLTAKDDNVAFTQDQTIPKKYSKLWAELSKFQKDTRTIFSPEAKNVLRQLKTFRNQIERALVKKLIKAVDDDDYNSLLESKDRLKEIQLLANLKGYQRYDARIGSNRTIKRLYYLSETPMKNFAKIYLKDKVDPTALKRITVDTEYKEREAVFLAKLKNFGKKNCLYLNVDYDRGLAMLDRQKIYKPEGSPDGLPGEDYLYDTKHMSGTYFSFVDSYSVNFYNKFSSYKKFIVLEISIQPAVYNDFINKCLELLKYKSCLGIDPLSPKYCPRNFGLGVKNEVNSYNIVLLDKTATLFNDAITGITPIALVKYDETAH
ncbi:MAG: hypothetical protein DKM50_02010 [Candidatus Margulisiibacteriota bacterium]|nr:MAG: hypothetical protein A2X43_05915 [Candidatus Margulisbacteria bacterium GWD2_39_127]OGI03311.1 MAG: hypothetical protein A2X42_08525 [Candidatus Margulisbacteria bacterium GWF2_38_17]OGI10351.1 MAG: hypothetical protein A2X41_11765 [Candidatus Margulisbacteria bacterium GWE2_39_32]PZM83678.1 MAG: hypothetical protein DKM50_02010 [Candidatus Margulisiibacteriota bacterium]HAR63011.1 hypothetical protein [Candidatus Margulisiibacteriota bacterium]